MKRFVATAAIAALLTSPAFAGGMAEPVMEAEVIAEETSTSGGFLVPLLLLAVVVAVASSGGSDTPAAAACVACD